MTITCDPGDRGTTQIIRSPRVVIEVLSPTTERIDRTRKLKFYRAHPTVEEYLLVDSRCVQAEIYRKAGDMWMYGSFERNDEITLQSLGIHFSLADAYIDVEFDEFSPDDDEFDD